MHPPIECANGKNLPQTVPTDEDAQRKMKTLRKVKYFLCYIIYIYMHELCHLCGTDVARLGQADRKVVINAITVHFIEGSIGRRFSLSPFNFNHLVERLKRSVGRSFI